LKGATRKQVAQRSGNMFNLCVAGGIAKAFTRGAKVRRKNQRFVANNGYFARLVNKVTHTTRAGPKLNRVQLKKIQFLVEVFIC